VLLPAAVEVMISIKRFLNRSEDEAVLWQVINLLLEKIGTHAVQGDRLEHEFFVKSLDRIRDSVAAVTTPETLLVTIGSAVQAMADHKQRVSRFIERHRREIQLIVSMLTETMVRMGGDNTQFAQTFQQLGDRLERAVALEDLQTLKVQLRECLRDFQDETLKRKTEMDSVITTLQQEVERTTTGSDSLLGTDPATGLPGQSAAEAAMLKALKAGTRTYVVTLVVSRIQSINARFGYNIGDQVLQTCRETVEKQLLSGDQMFRWTGPAIVLIIERADSIDVVRGQLKRILDARIEETYSLGSRAVLIPISLAWTALKLLSPLPIAVRQIQTFIASQGTAD
jgi:GGDEF domain-containing protein